MVSALDPGSSGHGSGPGQVYKCTGELISCYQLFFWIQKQQISLISYASSLGDFSSEGEKQFIEYSDERGTIRLDFLSVSLIFWFWHKDSPEKLYKAPRLSPFNTFWEVAQ